MMFGPESAGFHNGRRDRDRRYGQGAPEGGNETS